MSRFWSPGIAGLKPYVPGEQPRISGLIKLNTNENPYGPSPAALAAAHEAIGADLRLYPDPDSHQLREAVASLHAADGIGTDRVFVGNGSDEVLAHAFFAFFRGRGPVLMPDISYSFYPVYAALYDIAVRRIPVDEGLRIRVADYQGPAGGVVVASPNAPTGIPLDLDEIRSLLTAQPDSVVLVDEAYVDFGGSSAVSLVREHPNLLIAQTLSKSRSLAGLRVGFAIGDPALIDGLERVKNSFNSYPLDRVAIAAASAALRDREYFEDCRQRLMATRGRLETALRGLGFEVLPSGTNFVFTRHPSHDGAALARQLREERILVRHFAAPRIDQYLRISIGTDDQCERLVEVLAGIVRAGGA